MFVNSEHRCTYADLNKALTSSISRNSYCRFTALLIHTVSLLSPQVKNNNVIYTQVRVLCFSTHLIIAQQISLLKSFVIIKLNKTTETKLTSMSQLCRSRTLLHFSTSV